MALFLGLGTGGVFAWVAELAPAERVGAVTGIVGACGELGGFFPPLVIGATYNEAAHSYTIGLVLLTITAAGALALHALWYQAKDSDSWIAPDAPVERLRTHSLLRIIYVDLALSGDDAEFSR